MPTSVYLCTQLAKGRLDCLKRNVGFLIRLHLIIENLISNILHVEPQIFLEFHIVYITKSCQGLLLRDKLRQICRRIT
jgi:hypothetical protein